MRLSRLCQGVENPGEAIGILGGGAAEEIFVCHGRSRPNTSCLQTNKQTNHKLLVVERYRMKRAHVQYDYNMH